MAGEGGSGSDGAITFTIGLDGYTDRERQEKDLALLEKWLRAENADVSAALTRPQAAPDGEHLSLAAALLLQFASQLGADLAILVVRSAYAWIRRRRQSRPQVPAPARPELPPEAAPPEAPPEPQPQSEPAIVITIDGRSTRLGPDSETDLRELIARLERAENGPVGPALP